MDINLNNFKHVLEYFVAHLNYVQSKYSKSAKGYDQYIKPYIEGNLEFSSSGQGWKNGNIQNQIKNWEHVNDRKICINVQANFGDFTSRKCYLNWESTGINILCEWDKVHNEVAKLSIGYGYWWCKPTQYEILMTKSVYGMNLFNENDDSSELEEFYNKFTQEIVDYEEKRGLYYTKEKEFYDMEKCESYLNLLKSNHNIILTGAPGTGKTYLAKQIAQQMIFGELKKEMSDEEKKQFKEQCGFVQFHPSYDYTDFVEGLRPKSGNGNIGFKPIDGVFKEFCSNALENFLDAQKSEEELQKEIPISVRIEKFIQDSIVDTNKSFNTKKGNSFHIINNDKRKIQIEIIGSGNETLDLSKKRLISLLEKDNGTVKCAADIKKIFGNKYTNRKDSYIFPLYEDLKSNSQTDSLSSDVSNNSTVDKINKKNYVFIIDEINRGEISKIFGELFFSIDPGYRGTKGAVRTQYANMQTDIGEPNDFDDELGITEPENFGHFFVPENVYIIGTMNDIDRSVESMDFAFRRRFAFKEITAEETQSMLDSADAWNGDMPDSATIEEIKKRMDNLNKIIWHKNEKDENDEQKSIEGLSSAYHIGASYFLKLANYKNEDDSYNFDELWEYHLEGLLFEYLRGTTDVYKKLKRLATAYGYIKVDKYE